THPPDLPPFPTRRSSDLDHLLRRLDHSPNLKGLEGLGFKPYKSFDPRKYDLVVFVSAGKVRPPYGLAKLAKKAVGLGVFLKEEQIGRDTSELQSQSNLVC